MNKLITICINTSKKEKNYLSLLFKSLEHNLDNKNHEILVFLDSHIPEIVSFLLDKKSIFPNLKIIKNNWPIPVCYQENINYMFREAKHDIVSYIQSDMVVGPHYDTEVLKHIKPNMILSSTRVEPPLHPPSSEKYVIDFGLHPLDFRFEDFQLFVETNRKDNLTDFFFAPFTLYKDVWNKIGGHDVQFRRSREDSDILWRLVLNGVKIKQCWNAIVYHFTCTSSRGQEWWKPENTEAQRKASLQKQADQIELMKFIRKWGSFKHPISFEESEGHKYDIGAILKECRIGHINLILNMFPYFNHISIDDEATRSELKHQFKKLQDPANTLHGVSEENWKKYGKYYKQPKFENIFTNKLDNNVIVEFSMTNTNALNHISNLSDIINGSISEGEVGECELDGMTIKINGLKNLIEDNIVCNNPKFDFDLEIL